MKYRDLIHFDPPQKVVQLRNADNADVGKELVSSYVISDQMAENLTARVFPQLQYDNPKDNKALLVVGNYGTGKSHLLSVISTLAENANVRQDIRHPKVREAADGVAGRFKVLRMEIGATTMALRDFLCDAIQDWLQEQGIDFVFRPMSEVWENKTELSRMMAAFQKHYPDHGLLLVVDELLDYLRSRNHQALPLDLGFLREIGEVCKDLRLRFIAGVQESLFGDASVFQFVSDSLKRVKDRFEDFRIAREDLAFVIAERLLHKTSEQKALIRQHLSKFTQLFGSLQEKLDAYVNLFPIHPTYLDVFERVRFGEKRQALGTISNAMQALLDQEVPADQPGLIAYDSYWREITSNQVFRADPDIKKVINCVDNIIGKVTPGFSNSPILKRFIDPAIRILHGLAVQRLTEGNITAPVGVTVEQLRDELLIIVPGLPMQTSLFLKTNIENILKEIQKTVSGQFLSTNPENGQYYLDINKDIDFDAQIAAKADTLGPDILDQYYFRALTTVMECTESTHVPGYQIWEHEIEWREHKVGRPGYLFFGAPNQRSTAHPPREFYLYFLQPFSKNASKIMEEDGLKSDEVFFRLTRRDQKFELPLKLYAAASELSTTSGSYRPRYLERANHYMKQLTAWLRDNLPSACDVTYQGSTKKLLEWGRTGVSSKSTLRELINGVASTCLGQRFTDTLKGYPRFSQLITRENRRSAIQDALLWLAGNRRNTANGKVILDALELLDGDQLRAVDHKEPSRGSRYATHFYQELTQKGPGQVLNRSEMIVTEHNGQIQYDHRFKLEPDLLVVALAALVAAENVTLAVVGKKFDAASLAELAKVPVQDLAEFKHIERPKDFDVGALRELFKLLGLNEGLALVLVQGGASEAQAALQQLQEQVGKYQTRTLTVATQVKGKLILWDSALLSDLDQQENLTAMDGFKGFLESVALYNTPAKFKNFKFSAAEVAAWYGALDRLKQCEGLKRLIDQLNPKIFYLQTAASALPTDHAWAKKCADERQDLLEQLKIPKRRQDGDFQRELGERLESLKQTWRSTYEKLHTQHRLTLQEDKQKAKLLHQDSRVQQLRKLTEITHLPGSHLDGVIERLIQVRACWQLTAEELNQQPLCPHCHYRPREESGGIARDRLPQFEQEVDQLIAAWTEKLLMELEDPVVQEERMPLLSASHQQHIQGFLKARTIPDPVTTGFVQAVNEALADLIRVVLSRTKLEETFAGPAMTSERFESLFKQLHQELVKGKDLKKVRIVLE